jgi:hypothetical protein
MGASEGLRRRRYIPEPRVAQRTLGIRGNPTFTPKALYKIEGSTYREHAHHA